MIGSQRSMRTGTSVDILLGMTVAGARRWRAAVAVLASLVLCCCAGTAASAESMPGSGESLAVSADWLRSVGTPMTVTVEGVAGGGHRLFVYGGDREHGCDVERVENPEEDVTLTPTGGAPLAAGPFRREYTATPAASGRYIVCAYLDAPPERFPDAWTVGCFSVPNEWHDGSLSDGLCLESMLSPVVILATEAQARALYEEAQAKRAAIAQEEQHAREAASARLQGEEESKAHAEALARAEAESKAHDARCRVPLLRGHTLRGARYLLKVAGCRLGKVTIERHGAGPLHVSAQAPRRGALVRPVVAVSITLTSQ
jgi:hypothetical protein